MSMLQNTSTIMLFVKAIVLIIRIQEHVCVCFINHQVVTIQNIKTHSFGDAHYLKQKSYNKAQAKANILRHYEFKYCCMFCNHVSPQHYRDFIEVLSCNTLIKFFFENLYFLVTNVFSVSKLILWYLNMSSVDLATRFNIGMCLLNKEMRYLSFFEINRYNTRFK